MTNSPSIVCPRCRSNAAKLRAKSPVADAWIVFGCDICFYTWRSTEATENTDPNKYPQVFKLDPAEIAKLPGVPNIPPLRRPS